MIENVSESFFQLHDGQLVVTDSGYKKSEDLGKEDKVLSFRGDYKNILGIEKVPSSESVYKLKVNGIFSEIMIPKGSSVLSYRGRKSDRGSERLRWCSIGELKVGDMVVYNMDNSCPESTIGEEYLKNKKIARFLGYYTLVGFMNLGKEKVTFHIDSDYQEMAEDIAEIVKSEFNVEADAYEWMSEKYITVEDRRVVELCEYFGGKNKNRAIPEDIISANIDFLIEFTKPFVCLNKDKRGSYFRPSASLEMFLGYKRILFRLGSFANIYYCISKDKKFTYYAIVLNEKEYNNIKSIKGESRETWFRDGDFVFMRVDSVTEEDSGGEIFKVRVAGEGSYCNQLVFCK